MRHPPTPSIQSSVLIYIYPNQKNHSLCLYQILNFILTYSLYVTCINKEEMGRNHVGRTKNVGYPANGPCLCHNIDRLESLQGYPTI